MWSSVGEFCAIADWHPGVVTCSEEEIDGATHRRLMGATVRSWSVEFEPDGASEEEAVEIITGIFDAGLDQIASQYGG